MKIPEGFTEKQVLDTISVVANRLASRFKFGYHEIDDMKQMAFVFACEGLEKYDGVRPLENFLWTHIRNRLFNEKRNKYERHEKPCLSCPFYDPENRLSKSKCSEFEDKEECSLYSGWSTRNSSKKSLMNTASWDDANKDAMCEESEPISTDDLETIEKIERELPVGLREDWIRLKFGLKMKKGRKPRLLDQIRLILNSENE